MKILLSLLITLVLAQAIIAKSVKNNFTEKERELRKNPTPSQKLIILTYDIMSSTTNKYAKGATKVSREILKDEALVNNVQPEIMEFKKNLTSFIDSVVNTNKKSKDFRHKMAMYTDTIDNYTKMPEEKQTPEAKLIIEVLEKYDTQVITTGMALKLMFFVSDFERMIEEYEDQLDEKMSDWYTKYKSFDDPGEKFVSFNKVFDMYYDLI